MGPRTNQSIAAKLREMADLLAQQQADGFHVAAYRRAAQMLDTLQAPIEEVVREKGLQGVIELPTIDLRH